MDDLERVLHPDRGADITLAAEHAATVPDFASVLRRGTRRRRTRVAFAAAAAVVAVVTVLGGVQLVGAGQRQQPAVPPTPVVTHAMPTGDAALEPGTYAVPVSDSSDTRFSVTFPAGWSVQYGHTYRLASAAPAEVTLTTRSVDAIYADACQGDQGAQIPVGPTAADLVAALIAQPGADVSDPVPTTLGGLPATRVDLVFPAGRDQSRCSYQGAGLQIWHQKRVDDYLVVLPNGRVSVYVVDVNGARQVFDTQYTTNSSEADRASLQAVLESIRFP